MSEPKLCFKYLAFTNKCYECSACIDLDLDDCALKDLYTKAFSTLAGAYVALTSCHSPRPPLADALLASSALASFALSLDLKPECSELAECPPKRATDYTAQLALVLHELAYWGYLLLLSLYEDVLGSQDEAERRLKLALGTLEKALKRPQGVVSAVSTSPLLCPDKGIKTKLGHATTLKPPPESSKILKLLSSSKVSEG